MCKANNKLKLYIVLIFLVAILLLIFSIKSNGYVAIGNKNYNGFKYDESETEITISKYDGDEVNVTIPSEINGKAVTKLNGIVFYGCDNLETISIPKSVLKINSYGSASGSDFVSNCTKLTNIYVDALNEEYCSENGILYNKDKTVLIKYPEAKKEKEFVVPSSVTSIATKAFDSCENLTVVEISKEISKIGKDDLFGDIYNVFSKCNNLTEIKVDEQNQNFVSENGVLYDKQKKTLISYPAKKKEKNYVVPSTVTTIVREAFSSENIESIQIGKNVEKISYNSFANCEKLELFIVEKNSYARTYARNNSIAYKYVGENKIYKTLIEEEKKKQLIGVELGKNTVEQLLKQWEEVESGEYTIKFYKNEQEITGEQLVGTGTKVKVTGNSLNKEYTIVVYGDVTGNGKPSAVDALAIIKNSTGKVKFKEVDSTYNPYQEASYVVSRDTVSWGGGGAVDALAIIKASLGRYKINQTTGVSYGMGGG